MPIVDNVYGITFDANVGAVPRVQLDATFSGAEDLVLNCRVEIRAEVEARGPADELTFWRVGFVQNVVADSACAYYGLMGAGQCVERVLKVGHRFPLRDARPGLGIWQHAPAGGKVNPPNANPAGGNVITVDWTAYLRDQPDVAFEWYLGENDLPLSGTRGSTTFDYWLLALRGNGLAGAGAATRHVLASGRWGVIWATEVTDIDAEPPRTRVTAIAGSGSYDNAPARAVMQLAGPDINGQTEFKISDW